MLETFAVPPYETYYPVTGELADQPGYVLLASATTKEFFSRASIDSLRAMRRRSPGAHLILHFEDGGARTDSDFSRLAVELCGACGVAPSVTPKRCELVKLLHVKDVDNAVITFIIEQVPHISDYLLILVQRVITTVCADGLSEAQCKRLSRAGIPRPDRIVRLCRALPVALRLQLSPCLPISLAAIEAGFSDGSSFSGSCARLFGLRPTDVKSLAGYRYILWQWWLRHARSGPQFNQRCHR